MPRQGETSGCSRVVRPATLLMLATLTATVPAVLAQSESRWWKGNLHTHTLWSDGDDYPEMVLGWYKDNGYHFVAISDHNILSEGPKWVHPDQSVGGEPRERLDRYVERFGDDWVDIETSSGQRAVRLKTFDEYRKLFDEAGAFLTIQAQEITDAFGDAALHINATNTLEYIQPRGGMGVVEVLMRNIDAVYEQRRRTGQPMFAHLNHPNFRWSISLDEFVAVENETFFEVYNGHPGVNNDGGAEAPSMDVFWDHALTSRLRNDGRVLWGLAVDDAHHYGERSVARINPGRGWVMVRAEELTAASLIEALEAGEFYSTSGVALTAVERNERELRVRIDAREDVAYTTEFIGARRDGPAGEVLAIETGRDVRYSVQGDELYVRARITSSKEKVNGYRAGELERAWTQPLIVE